MSSVLITGANRGLGLEFAAEHRRPRGQTTGNVDYEAWGYVAAGLGPSKEALLLA